MCEVYVCYNDDTMIPVNVHFEYEKPYRLDEWITVSCEYPDLKIDGMNDINYDYKNQITDYLGRHVESINWITK